MDKPIEKEVKLKSLKTRRTELAAEVEELKRRRQDTNSELTDKQGKLDKIDFEITRLENNSDKEVIISEHALLRYFERVLGFNISEIKEKISEPVIQQYRLIGNGKYPIEKGYKAVIKNNVIVTIE